MRYALPRRGFLKAALGTAAGSAIAACARTSGRDESAATSAAAAPAKAASGATPRMPVLFVGHGSPMNAIEDNEWSRGFRTLAKLLPAPKAILAVSAHWFVRGTYVTADERPETIHDFGGFPEALYAVQYPAPGDVALAERTAKLLGDTEASLSNEWGLDHGTWSVLLHLRPGADVPVVQLSIDQRLRPEDHLEIGRRLAPLRDEGVLILGSGNLTHNLRHAMTADRTVTPGWARSFDADCTRALEQHDAKFLRGALATGDGRQSHPTPDHFLPVLHVAGASDDRDTVRFPVTGFDLGSLSMRAVLLG